jgi:hypothetical protein
VDHQKPALDGTGEVEVTNESNGANTDEFSAVTHAAVTAPDGILPFKPTRKALPTPAPWR